jgi:hypothetical protein
MPLFHHDRDGGEPASPSAGAAFQVLVLARLLIRRETPYKGAIDIDYRISADGAAAVAAGDAGAVIDRRLPA